MHMRRKLSVAVAALIVSTQLGSVSGVAAPSAVDIGRLQDRLIAQDYQGMAAILGERPEILADGSPLATTLQTFLADFTAGAFTAFTADDLVRLEALMVDACRATASVEAGQACIY